MTSFFYIIYCMHAPIINNIIGKVGGNGLYPDNPVQRALIDEVLDSCEDVINAFVPSFREQDNDKKKAMRIALQADDKIPYWINKFQARFDENEKRGNKNGYIVGDKVCTIKHAYISLCTVFD